MSTTTQHSYVRQAPYIEARQKDLLTLAENRSKLPIPGETFDIGVADPSELQLASYATGRGIGQYSPYVQHGADTLSGAKSAMEADRGQIRQRFEAGAGTLADAATDLRAMSPIGSMMQGEAAQIARGAGQRFDAPTSYQGYAAQGFDPSSVSAYMNPYEDQAVQQALGDISRQGDIARNRLAGQAVQAGAFGGARQGLQEAELGRNILEQQGRTAAGMRQAGYQQAMGQAQQSFMDQQRRAHAQAQFGTQTGMSALQQQQQRQLQQAQMLSGIGGLQGSQAIQRAQALGQLGTGLAGIGAGQAQEGMRYGAGLTSLGTQQANIAGLGQNILSGQATLQSQLGAQQQAQQQRQFDADRAAGIQRAYEPFQRMGWMSDILKPTVGTAQSTIGTTTAPTPSPLSQLIGGGIAGMGVNKYLGNPLGFSGFGSKSQ